MPKKSKKTANADMLNRVEERAFELEKDYGNCSQCTLVAIQEAFGQVDYTLAKASTLLAGGVGRMGNVCGVLTGAILAIGTMYGRDPDLLKGPAEEARKAASSPDIAPKLCKWFEREFGSINCRELRKSVEGTTLSREVPWEKEVLDRLDAHRHCAEMAGKTARRAVAMLNNPDLSIMDEA